MLVMRSDSKTGGIDKVLTRKLGAIALSATLLGLVFATISQVTYAGTGNGAPSGPHYNLNLIGVKKTDQLPNDENNGHRIFINLQGKSKIYLQQGDDFGVIDADATDGKAIYQLPGANGYTVWVRTAGKPGGNGQLYTCAEDELGNEICSMNVINLSREKGQKKFQDVTAELTQVCADFDGDGDIECYSIFDAAFEGYLWEYDNNGLKVIQLRFYPIT